MNGDGIGLTMSSLTFGGLKVVVVRLLSLLTSIPYSVALLAVPYSGRKSCSILLDASVVRLLLQQMLSSLTWISIVSV